MLLRPPLPSRRTPAESGFLVPLRCTTARCRVGSAAACRASLPRLLDAEIVLHVLHAGDVLHAALSPMLCFSVLYSSREGNFASFDLNFDLRGIYLGVVSEAVAHLPVNPPV